MAPSMAAPVPRSTEVRTRWEIDRGLHVFAYVSAGKTKQLYFSVWMYGVNEHPWR
jgi:hypothetical protein